MEIGRAVPQLFQANAAQARISSLENLFGGKPLDLQAKPELVQEAHTQKLVLWVLQHHADAVGGRRPRGDWLTCCGYRPTEMLRQLFWRQARAVRNGPKHSATERRLACSAWASDAEAFARLDLQVYTAQYPRARLLAKSGLARPRAMKHKRQNRYNTPLQTTDITASYGTTKQRQT